MPSSRNGKIAKLPIQIREQLNVRISEGDSLKNLLGWLNNDPAVIEILSTHFGGRPISQQNMSEWRLGGYEEWLTNQEYFSDARAFAERRKFLDCSGISAEDLLAVITARWARLIDRMGNMDIISFNATVARWEHFTKSAAILRKLELQKARLDLDRETRRPKSERKDALASSSSPSTVPSKSISPPSDPETCVPSQPASVGPSFCPGVPCHPDEMIELEADMTEEEKVWQGVSDPLPPPAPPAIPAPVQYSNLGCVRPSVPDSKPVVTDASPPRPPVSGSSPQASSYATLTERIQAVLQARIAAGEGAEEESEQAVSNQAPATGVGASERATQPIHNSKNRPGKNPSR